MPQDAPAGTTIGHLDATDLDRGLNAEMRFQLVSGNASEIVEVAELGGAVMTRPGSLAPGRYDSVVQVRNVDNVLSGLKTL